MDQVMPYDPALTDGASLAAPPSETAVVRSATLVMLAMNLFLAAYFGFFVVIWSESVVDLFPGMGVKLPAITAAVLSVPAAVYRIVAGGLAAIVAFLVLATPWRKAAVAANAIATVLLVSGIILVDLALKESTAALVRAMQK